MTFEIIGPIVFVLVMIEAVLALGFFGYVIYCAATGRSMWD